MGWIERETEGQVYNGSMLCREKRSWPSARETGLSFAGEAPSDSRTQDLRNGC